MIKQQENIANVMAAILVGGLGTRLRSVVADSPKVLAVINGRPFLSYLLDKLVNAGMQRAVLCTGYMSDKIKSEFGKKYGSLSLYYSEEETALGTAGALKHAEKLFKSDILLIMNGDSYCDVNLTDFWIWHCKRHSVGSIILVKVPEANRYGSVQCDNDEKISIFEEKSCRTAEGWINAGIYLLNKSLIQTIPDKRIVSLEREMFPHWIEQESILGYHYNGIFVDIGVPSDLEKAKTLMLNHKYNEPKKERT
jgi:NDP-sugar pyrophosphorylase family protein